LPEYNFNIKRAIVVGYAVKRVFMFSKTQVVLNCKGQTMIDMTNFLEIDRLHAVSSPAIYEQNTAVSSRLRNSNQKLAIVTNCKE